MGEAYKKVLSKYRGVTKFKGSTKWSVFTGGGGNLKWHGSYLTEKEAARVRNRMMIERYGFDPNPNVIEGSEVGVTKYSVSGNTEFIIRAINHMRLRGGGILCINVTSGETPYALRGRIKSLLPLLVSQSYISDVIVDSNIVCDVNLNECVLDIGGPWITVPKVEASAKVLFHRRQTFKSIPVLKWKAIANRFSGQYAFIGDSVGAQLLRTQTQIDSMPVAKARNLLIAAQFIAGAELFIGNQSPMFEIAIGLGIKAVLEGTKEFDELATPASPTQS